MKQKRWSILALLLALLLGLTFAFAACSTETGGDSGEEEQEQEEEQEEEITSDVAVTLIHAPNLSYDSTNSGLTDDSIMTDTLSFSYSADATLTLYIEDDANITVSNGTTSVDGDTKTNTYTVTATAAGDYVLRIKEGDDLAAKYTFNVAEAYPEEPNFNRLVGYGQSSDSFMAVANAHDPAVIEVNGVYYAFSTDNVGSYGYQVRKSTDLIRWEYIGAAIENCGTTSTAASLYAAGNGGLQEVYDILSTTASDWADTWTLWAPEVVPAADGGYWLYGCWTAAFGSRHSIIFLCHADDIEGPYEYVDIIVYSYDSTGSWPNAIDAAVYYDPEGNMYMSYGSFSGGIYMIELDPETGLRKDGLTGDDLLPGSSQSAATRYGACLVANSSTEGSTVSYHEGVEIYAGDPTSYDASAVTTQNLYYMMTSSNDLSSTYNMRSYSSSSPTSGFTGTVTNSTTGDRVSGSFSWKTSINDDRIDFDFAYPGHNDMITTTAGKNLLVYHNRLSFASGSVNHYLFTSLYGFNSRGELVMNPNRYAGETERVVTEAEITQLSDGYYSVAYVTDNTYSSSFNGGYAMDGALQLKEDGTVVYNNSVVGSWVLYGDNWVYLNITTAISAGSGSGTLSGKFYGMVFPAYIETQETGGLSMSFVSENGTNTLYMNMYFGV